MTVCLATALVSCLVVRFDFSRLHWWDYVCPRSSDGPASFFCAHRAVVAGDVVCAVAMWLVVLLADVLVLCFDLLSCVRKRPVVHFLLLFVGCSRWWCFDFVSWCCGACCCGLLGQRSSTSSCFRVERVAPLVLLFPLGDVGL